MGFHGTDDEEPMNTSDSEGMSPISCSICLEPVEGNAERSYAKLQCGHDFHLDCIGSAFNVKGMMQCPNCRKTENGRWLYANGPHSLSNEFSLVDWPHEEDLYDLNSEMPFGAMPWRCPYSGLTHFFPQDTEWPLLPSIHDLLGRERYDPLLAEHHWNHLFGPSDISHSHILSNGDPYYRPWEHSPPFSATSSQVSNTDPDCPAAVRTSRGDSDAAQRSGSILHPFVHNRGSGSRVGSSVAASMMAPYQTADHDRVEGHHPIHHQPQFLPPIWPIHSNNARRSGGSRILAPAAGPPPAFSEHASGVYALPPQGSSGRNIHEAVNPVQTPYYPWESDRFTPYPLVPTDRDSGWWPMGAAIGGSDYGNRGNSHRQRRGQDRSPIRPVPSRAENPSYRVPPGHPFM